MKASWSEEIVSYDGTQLAPRFAYQKHGLVGDSIVSWQGPCAISFENMKDLEDVISQSKIEGSMMVHFIVEVFDWDLKGAVALQRLLASIVKDVVDSRAAESSVPAGKKEVKLIRKGDDLYLANTDKKLSISVATASNTSCLIHFAVNVSNEGTPVPTCSLNELRIDVQKFGQAVMANFVNEYGTILEARSKTR
ncbi:MAG: DUF366 domain-containing protein [Bdellovibrionales bacterium CG10_big_fil_rev_8_21_14_0_10_45_34]|nr:MAG: DUF366 domain-containing protein [Bdellovibrionales bacterium CG10_big_fil_rev_8_21_14_0_10_45_34]